MTTPRLTSSTRLDRVKPFKAMSVMQRAEELEAQGRKIVHMEVGEPDFTTAGPIVTAGIEALQKGRTQYTAAAGLDSLRAKIADHYKSRYCVSVDPQRVFVTPGASAGLVLLANLLIEPGSGVLLPDPAYPCIRNFIHLRGAQPQLVPVSSKQNFQPRLEGLENARAPDTSGVWLASPSNPTGTILERDQLAAICQWTSRHGLHFLMDEIYHGLHYVADMPSVLELDQSCFVVNSFSKYFGMTGWRIGWIVVPDAYVDTVNSLAQNLYISAPTVSQYAAMAAFEEPTLEILEHRREAFRQRRDFLVQALEELGFKLPESIQGAFYIYAGIEKFSANSEEFCADMLEKHGVAITPGSDFGEHGSDRYVRFAFTTSMDDLRLAVSRLAAALA